MGFMKKYKDLIGLILGLGIYVLFITLSGIRCPIKFLTGISCPGCGMTRAILSALTLDFESAFDYHPLWCVLLPALALIFAFKLYGKKRALNISIYISCAVLITVYAIRLVIGDGTVVAFQPKDGLIYKMLSRLFN